MLARDSAPRASIEALTRVHPAAYVAAIEQASPKQGRVRVDQDTSMSPGSLEAALRAAGGAVFAVDEVLGGRADNAFVATRPPGHHAETSTPMGFCFFNNAAVAARHAQAVHGLERIAIVDFDVHHGQRHAGYLLERQQRALRFDASDAAVPGHGRSRRARRA